MVSPLPYFAGGDIAHETLHVTELDLSDWEPTQPWLDVTVDANAVEQQCARLLPVDAFALKNSGTLTYTSQLTNPAGTIDRVPTNNRRSSTLSVTK